MGRDISSNKEFGRIFGFPLAETYPSILQLVTNLENGQRVYVTEENAIQVAHSPKDHSQLSSSSAKVTLLLPQFYTTKWHLITPGKAKKKRCVD